MAAAASNACFFVTSFANDLKLNSR
jgi:hypothetical protein